MGQNIKWSSDVSTKTASLDLLNILLNSFLSRKGAKFATFDIKNFYIHPLLDRPEYVHIKLADIPLYFIDEFNLQNFFHANGWV